MTTLDYTILRDCLYAYMHVHINMCKYQWEEFGGQPQGSYSAHVFPAQTTYTQTTVLPSNFNNLIKSTCDPNIQKETIFP